MTWYVLKDATPDIPVISEELLNLNLSHQKEIVSF